MAKTNHKKAIFLSHASNDKGVVQAYVDHLFDETALGAQGYRLFFTSTANLEGLLPGGAQTWRDISDALKYTTYFVAFLSEAYFDSEWCIAELAIFQATKIDLPPQLVSIDEDCEGRRKDCPLTQDRNVLKTSIDELQRVVAGIRNAGIPLKASIDFAALRKQIDTAIQERDERKKGIFYAVAREHFSRPRAKDNPISFFVERDEYEQTSINMARSAENVLLWTLFGSPLLVADSYSRPDYLMPYDVDYEKKCSARKKVRVVIFRDKKEIEAYLSCDEEWHNSELLKHKIPLTITHPQLLDRKLSFEKSATAGGELYFTDPDKLLRCVAKPPTSFTPDTPLEFAYADYRADGSPRLLMETGFSSPFSMKWGSGTGNPQAPSFGHVTFYKPLKELPAERIKAVDPYTRLYGHLGHLWEIAEKALLMNPDPTIFRPATEIHKLLH